MSLFLIAICIFKSIEVEYLSSLERLIFSKKLKIFWRLQEMGKDALITEKDKVGLM